MSKIVRPSHIIGERGVNVFADYCNRHQPYIIWREETKNDFGIDGEVELTEVNEDGKIKPTSQTLKVQIKSTQSSASYIQQETDESFSFFPREEDLEYWKSYRVYGYDVLLVVFDGREGADLLYCKRITDIDEALVRPKGKRKSQPIVFSKTENRLVTGQHDFDTKYRASFKSRVNYLAAEVLDTNMFPFKTVPRWLYTYPTHYKTKKDIFKNIASGEAPYFVIYNSIIYTFVPIEKDFKPFYEHVVSEGQKRTEHRYSEVVDTATLRNHFVELLNEYLKDFMRKRGLYYQRDFRRFYFFLRKDQTEYKVPYRTRRAEKVTEKKVVEFYEYGKDTFFRHLAVAVKPLFIEDRVYLIISPKYYFTSDRTAPLEPEKTTKFTNYLNRKTFNDGVVDQLHFWWHHLAKGSHEATVFDGSAMNQPSILLSRPIDFTVPFGIPLDGEKVAQKKKAGPKSAPAIPLPSLFDNQ